jgi:hypothetical protein
MVLALADDTSTEELRRVAPGYFATSSLQDRPSLEANVDPSSITEKTLPSETTRKTNARPRGIGSCLLKRMAFDAGSEVGRFSPVERRFFQFGHIVLHDQRIANGFHIDGHSPAVVGSGGAGGDVRM